MRRVCAGVNARSLHVRHGRTKPRHRPLRSRKPFVRPPGAGRKNERSRPATLAGVNRDLWYPITEPTSRGGAFRSAFGGTWPDLADAERWLDGMHETGILTDDDAERFRFWIEHGYLILPGAVPAAHVDALNGAIERLWRESANGSPFRAETFDGTIRVEPLRPELRGRPHKVLNLHAQLPEATRVVMAAPVLRFLRLLFLRPPMAFQSLYFTVGTRQHMHQDTAYVVVNSPLEFAGVWIALEDVQPHSGELQYFDKSHRIPEYLFHGKWRSKPSDDPDDEPFLRWVHEQSVARGCELRRFRPKQGDALVWHADLAHGGAQDVAPGTTRKSIVTHFCPKDVLPAWYREGMPYEPRRHHADVGAYTCWYRY